MFLMHIYLSGDRVHLSIRSPKNKMFISHVEDVTLPKSIREAHGLQLGTICVENHVQILSNQWIVLEVQHQDYSKHCYISSADSGKYTSLKPFPSACCISDGQVTSRFSDTYRGKQHRA